jgi:hypothetical protein
MFSVRIKHVLVIMIVVISLVIAIVTNDKFAKIGRQ